MRYEVLNFLSIEATCSADRIWENGSSIDAGRPMKGNDDKVYLFTPLFRAFIPISIYTIFAAGNQAPVLS